MQDVESVEHAKKQITQISGFSPVARPISLKVALIVGEERSTRDMVQKT